MRKLIPVIGFSLGIERIIVALSNQNDGAKDGIEKRVFIIGIKVGFVHKLKVKRKVTENGFLTDTIIDVTASIRKQMDTAVKPSAAVVFIGQQELNTSTVKIKIPKTKE